MPPKKEYSSPNLVPGEASESDEDDVILKMMKSKSASVGVIVAGEASESSDDTETEEDSFSSAAEVYSRRVEESFPKRETPEKIKYKSLLHKKLCTSNASLQQDLFNFLHKPLIDAARKLNDSNQQLLGSQVQMQQATISMRQINSNLMKLDRALDALLSVPFPPDIRIPSS
ncbi:biogenesis of lysosome-related organelles complex 1 subunit 3 [Nilaparvata lugens]|uniref:biogenesis of lysosome-related organelles complex 1 subunit 3 n=1 Tax=Nilaparvata lugens TaxID=108931 RepID=UPI00193EB179|nr:biogenesis of lysosome-related organelles complex 1 subunit 3 [Nilaparvata lugens]